MSLAAQFDPSHLDLNGLAQCLGMTRDAFCRALGGIANGGYDTFVLRDGKKRRVISAPRPWLKELQRAAHDKILSALPISQDVYGVAGRGVIQNAEQHLSNPHMVVLDVADCFPSTQSSAVLAAIKYCGFPATTSGALTRLSTFNGILPQGPPTSPAILNLVFRPIDEALGSLAPQHDARYTRYMDDLCFSGPIPLRALATSAAQILRDNGYRINERKRRVWGPGDPHTVTKIVVTTTLNPNPDFLLDLAEQISKLARRPGAVVTSAMRGKIAWVTQLNRDLGARLRQQIAS